MQLKPKVRVRRISIVVAILVAIACVAALTALLRVDPLHGYSELRLPQGHEFPAPEAELLGYRDEQRVSKMRAHAWDLFAGLTDAEGPRAQRAPIWETWFTRCEVRLGPCLPEIPPTHNRSDVSSNQRRLLSAMSISLQELVDPVTSQQEDANKASVAVTEDAVLEAIGKERKLALVLYNRPAMNHILHKQLYSKQSLDLMLKSRIDANSPEAEREVPPFPRDAVALKFAWQIPTPEPDSDHLLRLFVWDPKLERERQTQNGQSVGQIYDWGKYVKVDPTTQGCEDRDYLPGEVIPIGCFYAITINSKTPFFAPLLEDVNHSPLRGGKSFLILMGVHVVTKETADWVWATFWWYNIASRDYGWDRPNSKVLRGNKWRHFVMDTTLSDTTPLELDYGHKICFNRYLEQTFANGLVSNCIQCHKRAVYSPQDVTRENCGYELGHLPRCTDTTQGRLPQCGDVASQMLPSSCVAQYYKNVLKTDFLWTIPRAQAKSTKDVQNIFVDLLKDLQRRRR